MLHNNLLKMFSVIFETRLGTFVGVHCCPALSVSVRLPYHFGILCQPFLLADTQPSNNSILALMATLDNVKPISDEQDHFDDRNDATNAALIAAIRAFSLKFLVAQMTQSDHRESCEDIQSRSAFRLIWLQAIQAAQFAMAQPSYRSILTLYVVAITALSIHDSNNGCFEDSCLAGASGHIIQLNGDSPRHKSSLNHDITRQNVAYWCGMVVESGCRFTRPLTLGKARSFAGDDQFWVNVRDQTSLFHQSFQCLHGMLEPMSREVLAVVLQHATMQKCMAWWDLSSIHCASADEEMVGRVKLAVQDVLTFQEVFVPLLDLVARDFLLIHPKDQLNYGEQKAQEVQFSQDMLIVCGYPFSSGGGPFQLGRTPLKE